jgi:hypothetical protein
VSRDVRTGISFRSRPWALFCRLPVRVVAPSQARRSALGTPHPSRNLGRSSGAELTTTGRCQPCVGLVKTKRMRTPGMTRSFRNVNHGLDSPSFSRHGCKSSASTVRSTSKVNSFFGSFTFGDRSTPFDCVDSPSLTPCRGSYGNLNWIDSAFVKRMNSMGRRGGKLGNRTFVLLAAMTLDFGINFHVPWHGVDGRSNFNHVLRIGDGLLRKRLVGTGRIWIKTLAGMPHIE